MQINGHPMSRSRTSKIPSTIPQLFLHDCRDNRIQISPNGKFQVFFFISLYCVRCIEFISVLKDVKKKLATTDFVVFSAGDNKRNEQMVSYFNWDFPVISLQPDDMLNYFNVSTMPYMIYVNKTGDVEISGLVHSEQEFLSYLEKIK